MTGTFWALVPAILAIALALITKEVYSSLFCGIVLGGIFFAIEAGSGFTGFMTHVVSDGFVGSLADSYNVGILIFLVILGIMVALMNRAGGSAALETGLKSILNQRLAHSSLQFFSAFLFLLTTISTVLLLVQ